MPYFIKQTNGSQLKNIPFSNSENLFFTDLDGDGREDLLVGTESGEFTAYRNTEHGYSLFDRDFSGLTGRKFGNITNVNFADIDGDGDGDAVIRLANGKVQILQNNEGSFFSIGGINTDLVANNNPYQRFFEFETFMTNLGLQPTATSQNTGTPEKNQFGRIVASSDFVRNAGWADQNQYVRKLADVNGDGRIDIIGFGPDRVFTALGQADGSFGQTTVAMQDRSFTIAGGWTSQHELPRQVADINGDGYADIVGFGHDRVYTRFGQSDGTFSNHYVVSTSNQYTLGRGWISQDKYPRLLADVNGDGRSDIVGFARDAVFTSLGQEDGTFATIQHSVNTSRLFYSDGWVSQNQLPRQMADVNGDGRADIVGFGQDQVFVAFGLSNGQFGESFIASTDFTRAKGWASQNQFPRKVVDVNGDGRADIVGFKDGTAYVALGLNNGTFKAAFEAPELALSKTGSINLNLNPLGLADVDGDGQVDLIEFGDDAVEVALNPTAEPPASEPENNQTSSLIVAEASLDFVNNTGWSSQDEYPRQLIDLNNDGRVDIIGFGPDRVFTALGQADGSFGQTTIAMQDRSFTIAGSWTSHNQLPRQVADINGDGYADIVGFGHDRVFTRLGQSGGTFSNQYVVSTSNQYTLGGGWVSQDRYPRFLADVNGDGRSDIIGFGHGSVLTSLGQADGSFADFQYAYTSGLSYSVGWDSQDYTPRQMADVNGDGRADIVAFGQDQVFVALGQSNGKFAPSTVASEDFTRARGWFVQSQYPRKVIDVNGDGRADIVGLLNGATYVALSQGDGTFAPATETSEWIFNFDGWLSTNQNPLDFGDVDGDGQVELVVFRDDAVQVSRGGEIGGSSSETEEHGNDDEPNPTVATDEPPTEQAPAVESEGEEIVDDDAPKLEEVIFADIDGDGDDDKLVNQGDDSFEIYLNDNGTYTLSESSEVIPVQLAELQEGEAASADDENSETETKTALAPDFADLDGDGDLDAVVGYDNGDVEIYLNQSGESVLIGTLENVGEDVKPALGDLDNDGDLDVLIGDVAGKLHYYQNQTSQGNGFVRKTGKKNPFQYVDVGYDAQPSFADIDNDGDADIVVTDREGRVHHYDSFTATPSLNRFYSHFQYFAHYRQTSIVNGRRVYDDAKTAQTLWGSQDRNPRYLADVNGDGRDDLVGFGQDQVTVVLASSGNFEGERLRLGHPNFGFNPEAGGWTSNNLYPRQLADVNGDGRADIVGFGQNETLVALGRENGTFGWDEPLSAHAGFNRAGEWNSQNQLPRRLADLNGDGRADIVGFGHGGVYTSLGQADGTFADGAVHAHSGFGFTPGWTNENLIPRLVGDVNGDGYGDIVQLSYTNVVVALGKGDGTFSENLLISSDNRFTVAGGWESQDKHPRHLADMNGDGLDDLVGFHDTGIEVALGRSNGTFAPSTVLRSNHYLNNLGWSSQDRFPRQLGDINGDGLADIVGFNNAGQTIIQFNNTVRPNPEADLFFESVFTTKDKNLWGSGDAFQFAWDFKEETGFEPIEWKFGKYSKEFGGFATFDSGGTEGFIDFNAGVEIDSGSIDAELPIVSWFGMPEVTPTLGQTATIKTGSLLAEDASFDTVFPYLNAYLDLDVDINISGPSVSFDVPLIKNDPKWTLGGEFDIDQALHLALDTRQGGGSIEHDGTLSTAADLHKANQAREGISLLLETKDRETDEKKQSKTAKKERNTSGKFDISSLSSYLDFEMKSLEDMDLTSIRQDDFTLVAANRQAIFETTIDVDNILTAGSPIKGEYGAEWDFGIGSVFGEINLFDADLVTEFTVDQEFTLEVKQVDGLFTFENGSTQAFKLGDDVDVLLAGHVVDTNNDNHADIDVTLTPQVTLRNQTEILYDVDLELSALSGAAGFDVEIDLGFFGSISYAKNTKLNPLWSDSIDIYSGSIYNYDETFALGGFGSQSYELTIPV